jgi:hypothetical protein
MSDKMEVILVDVGHPCNAGWNGRRLLEDVLNMKTKAVVNNCDGPWMLVHGIEWDCFMDDDYPPLVPSCPALQTVRMRLRQIESVIDVKRVRYGSDNHSNGWRLELRSNKLTVAGNLL